MILRSCTLADRVIGHFQKIPENFQKIQHAPELHNVMLVSLLNSTQVIFRKARDYDIIINSAHSLLRFVEQRFRIFCRRQQPPQVFNLPCCLSCLSLIDATEFSRCFIFEISSETFEFSSSTLEEREVIISCFCCLSNCLMVSKVNSVDEFERRVLNAFFALFLS